MNFLRELVDPKILTNRYEDLVRIVGDERFTTTIEEQGSGVRSLVCLVADILSEKDGVVKSIKVAIGDAVLQEDLLMELE